MNQMFIIAIITSVVIEFTQLKIGRTFDVDDIILNLIGAFLGYIVYLFIDLLERKLPNLIDIDSLVAALASKLYIIKHLPPSSHIFLDPLGLIVSLFSFSFNKYKSRVEHGVLTENSVPSLIIFSFWEFGSIKILSESSFPRQIFSWIKIINKRICFGILIKLIKLYYLL